MGAMKTTALLIAAGLALPVANRAAAWSDPARPAPAAPVAEVQLFKPQRLVLRQLPRRAGPRTVLFNGRDLSGWEAWLGYRDPAQTYRRPREAPLGHAGAGEVFKVVSEDGKPAIYVSGKTWGSLAHKGDFADYHLRLEFKWGKGRWAPRARDLPNNGLMYHSHGDPGAVFGTWMKSVEFEIMERSVGMVLPVASNMRLDTSVGIDRSLPAPHRRFMLGGGDVEIGPFSNVENARDAERPVGEWNTIDLYVLGDKAVHVVNGVPVMVVTGIRTLDGAGKATPLTHGRIQFQSEGAETFFRNIVIEPIRSLPVVTAR
jgi:hypothetical protein